jgi:hypothetical protein
MLDTFDWFIDQLAQQPDVFVADRDYLHQRYGVTTGEQFSLRQLTDPRHSTHLPVLVVRHDDWVSQKT